MVKSIIHVNRSHIAKNAKDGGNRPVYTIKTGGKTRYAREVQIQGPSTMVYDGRQLSCGARAWVETEAPLVLVDEMTFKEARDAKEAEAYAQEIYAHAKELEAKLDRAYKMMLPRAISAIYKDRKQEAIEVLETAIAELTGGNDE